MRGRERVAFEAALAAAVLLTGCGPSVQHRVPYLSGIQSARKAVRGAQVRVHFDWVPAPPHVTGELIAAGADSVWVLTGNHLAAIATPTLSDAIIQVYDGDTPGPPVLRLVHPGPQGWTMLARNARFPQGLPPGLDRSSLTAP